MQLSLDTEILQEYKKIDIHNRRYIGSKYKLSSWILDIINNNCYGNSFCDLFAGTAIISKCVLDRTNINNIVINDVLFSNYIIYYAFFYQEEYNADKLNEYRKFFNMDIEIKDNYFSYNFGNKFYSYTDALKIGSIREYIEQDKNNLNYKEYAILLASLVYSMDRISNTVGHYDAYIKNKEIKSTFYFDLITPIKTDKNICIKKEDANVIASNITSDIVYIDPPYNSRQYSRFYHVLENIIKWDKPKLYGVALKPEPENMSEYCRVNAPNVFKDLINKLNSKYILVSYNNTYKSKSNSSKNKIELDFIISTLEKKGSLKIHNQKYRHFSTGKTDFDDHREYLFLVEVK